MNVTQEMIAAGREAGSRCFKNNCGLDEFLARVYQAMRLVDRNPSPQAKGSESSPPFPSLEGDTHD